MATTQAQFYHDFSATNDFYAADEGLQRPGGMVLSDGSCDVEAMGQWGWQLSQGVPLSSVLDQIRASDEWKSKHPEGPIDPDIPPVGTIRPLRVDGRLFRADDDSIWRWKMVTAFKAAQRWEAGEDLSGFIAWTRSVGALGWRVFLQHCYLDSCGPDWPPVPWVMQRSNIRPFVDFCYRAGLYVELVALCDCQDGAIGMDHDAQITRLMDILNEVSGATNVFVEVANEPKENGVDPVALVAALGLDAPFIRPVLMSYGLYPVTGSEPNFPVLDYVGDHPVRKPDWTAECGKTGHYQWEQCHVPCPSDEPPKFSEPGQDPEATEQDPSTSPDHAESAGAGFALSFGGTFHCTDGINAVASPGPLSSDCARRFFAGMDAMPLDVVLGDYSHDGVSSHPLAPINDPSIVGEVASRICGSKSYAVAGMPTDRWSPVAVNGWRIVESTGYLGQIIKLER